MTSGQEDEAEEGSQREAEADKEEDGSEGCRFPSIACQRRHVDFVNTGPPGYENHHREELRMPPTTFLGDQAPSP